ncbi:MAG: hypothetical protein WC202_11110 [Desulfobacterales bacterium]
MDTVEARRVLLCYWAVWEIDLSAVELAGRLGIFHPTASRLVKRSEKIVRDKGLRVPK